MKRGLGFNLLLLVLVISLISCSREQEGVLYQCADGTMVDDFMKCPEMQDVPDETAQEPVEKNATETVIPEEILEPEPSQEIIRDVYKHLEPEQTGTSYPNLNGWSVLEIINGLATYNPVLRGKFPAYVEYDRQVPGQYTRGGSQNKIEDPFFIMRRHTSGNSREFDIYNFRVELPVRPNRLYDELVSKHNDSKFKLVYPSEWEEWMKISCEKIESCRDIEAIRCWTDAGDEMYCWVHTTPGQGYTESIKYTMQAVNDDRIMFDTFEKFYCTPV